MQIDFSRWTTHELLVQALSEISVLKSEVEKFLKPRINIYIGNELQRRMQMLDSEKAVAVIEIDDAKGFPVGGAFDQAPAWSIDDPSIASLSPSDDGMSCEVVAIKPGNATLSVAAVLAGASLAGSCPVTVLAGAPAQIKVSLGAAVPQ